MKLNTKYIYAVAVVIGIGIGIIATYQPKQADSSELSPITNSSTAPNQSSASTDASHGTGQGQEQGRIEQHIVTAQSLVSKAISLSKQKDQTNNDHIVELVNQAIDATNQAISLNPNDPRGYAQRAKIYQTISQYMPEGHEQAVANYKMAVKLDPGNTKYCENLADLLLSSVISTEDKSDLSEAEKSLSEKEGSPRLDGEAGRHARDDSGKTRDDNSAEKLKQAVYYLQMAVEAEPTNPSLLKKLAEVKTQAGYIQSARNDYQQLLGLLTQKDQKNKIQQKIDSLNNLLAEASANSIPTCHFDQTSKNECMEKSLSEKEGSPRLDGEAGRHARDDNNDIVLPDEPPKLQAHHLANSNTVIAAPEENKSTVNSQQLNSNALSGTSVIPAGEKKVKICNNNLSPETQVYLTPETKTNQILFVKSKAPYNPESEDCAHFVAATAKPTSQDLEFRWLIIED